VYKRQRLDSPANIESPINSNLGPTATSPTVSCRIPSGVEDSLTDSKPVPELWFGSIPTPGTVADTGPVGGAIEPVSEPQEPSANKSPMPATMRTLRRLT
jgi:hypothetical protein